MTNVVNIRRCGMDLYLVYMCHNTINKIKEYKMEIKRTRDIEIQISKKKNNQQPNTKITSIYHFFNNL